MKKYFNFCTEKKCEFWKPKSVDLLDDNAHTITVVVHGELSSIISYKPIQVLSWCIADTWKIFPEIKLEVSMILVLNSRTNILNNEFVGMI